MKLFGPTKALAERLDKLQAHLRTENPVLLEVLPTYFRLDAILYRMGLLSRDESLATRIPWWPLISVLGTFSSGKSTFINHFVGETLQNTGNQAVDDKFTVVCFGSGGSRVLPGTALDADPRFPFYRMSEEIEKVAPGEGRRIDAYLQLKTTGSSALRGKTIIDSPGFDADDQRRSILRLTNHIVDLSDLVLVFFDARHPEPGAMQDTLQHLVENTVRRPDASKFLYILNQIDTTANEDNPEQVVGAWQRAIAQAGLISGRFYCIYNPDAAVPIADPGLRARFESKRDRDLSEIHNRMAEVEVQRSYRIISVLDIVANEIEQDMVPAITGALARWRKLTLLADTAAAVALLAVVGFALKMLGADTPESFSLWLEANPFASSMAGIVLFAVAISGHFSIRDLVARRVAAKLPERAGQFELGLRQAFLKNTWFMRTLFRESPVGWSQRTRKRFLALRNAAAGHIQRLNDMYTDPSGRRFHGEPEVAEPRAGLPTVE
ncbi:MAG: dynamin family protein [Alphaproteobacteria bacterium]|nr:dynamin family protein [Alphaproteobacteria bacterium]